MTPLSSVCISAVDMAMCADAPEARLSALFVTTLPLNLQSLPVSLAKILSLNNISHNNAACLTRATCLQGFDVPWWKKLLGAKSIGMHKLFTRCYALCCTQ
jgi:hypothetical protein